MMQDCHSKYGDVFTVPLLHRNFTFLLDPHVCGHFFKASDDEMSQYEVCEFAT
jgi:sterol 14-demethylase